MSLIHRMLSGVLLVVISLLPIQSLSALDLSIDSFTNPQTVHAPSKLSAPSNETAANAIGGYRSLSVLQTSPTGGLQATVADRKLQTSFSNGATGLVTVIWDGDSKPGLSTSAILNSKISLRSCTALAITVESFTHTKRDATVTVRLYNPFSNGSQFLEGSLTLSRSVRGVPHEISISQMRVGGSSTTHEEFPLGAIVLTVDEAISLSSITLQCPSDAFINLEKSDYEMGLATEPTGRRSVSRSSEQEKSRRAPQVRPQGTNAPTPSPTAEPVAVCGDGIIQQGEECDSGAAVKNSSCVNCQVVCPAPAKSGAKDGVRPKSASGSSSCAPPPTCGPSYKTCSQPTKRGGSQCCYDPETEDCIAFSSWGHPIARCVPKSGGCQEPNGRECKSNRGDRACCPSDSQSSCAQGGGIAFCSFSACGPNQTPCTTATGFRSEATMCCANETEQCTKTIEIMGYLIQTCTADPTACVNTGGTICTGNGTPRCCPAGTVCSASVDGFPNCIDKERTTSGSVAAAL